MLIVALSMGIIAGFVGLVLAVVSKKYAVQIDPRVEEIQSALPGVNCGACGFPGCSVYAEAIVNNSADVNLCAPGSSKVASRIAEIIGVQAVFSEPHFATIACHGDGVQERFRYEGVRTCKAASVSGLAGSFQDCSYGCLGLGSCVDVCSFGAIKIGADGLPCINELICTGCKKCMIACPRGLLRVDAESRVIFIRCSNLDKGAAAMKACSHACISCGKCVRECEFDAVHVINNIARIDYDKCKYCGKCVDVCPKHCIIDLTVERSERKKARVF